MSELIAAINSKNLVRAKELVYEKTAALALSKVEVFKKELAGKLFESKEKK